MAALELSASQLGRNGTALHPTRRFNGAVSNVANGANSADRLSRDERPLRVRQRSFNSQPPSSGSLMSRIMETVFR
jgi:hypothetical protein